MGDSEDFKSNCFGLIKVIAAIQVFYGHASFYFGAQSSLDKVLGFFQGVPIFFIISGFLIWESIGHTGSFNTYCKKRILRLYPELWGGVLLSVISIMLLYSKYLDIVPFIVWIFTQITVFQFWTPNCLRGYGCDTPNGSLWTISVMVQIYFIMWFLYKMLHKKGILRWLILLIIGILFNIVAAYSNEIMPLMVSKLFRQTFAPYIWLFLLGAFYCEYRKKLLDSLIRNLYMFWGCSFIAYIIGVDAGVYDTIRLLFLAPALIGFAYRFPELNPRIDLSYGLYIYHMVIINFIIHTKLMDGIPAIFCSFLISLVFAYISYVLLGKYYRKGKVAVS